MSSTSLSDSTALSFAIRRLVETVFITAALSILVYSGSGMVEGDRSSVVESEAEIIAKGSDIHS